MDEQYDKSGYLRIHYQVAFVGLGVIVGAAVSARMGWVPVPWAFGAVAVWLVIAVAVHRRHPRKVVFRAPSPGSPRAAVVALPLVRRPFAPSEPLVDDAPPVPWIDPVVWHSRFQHSRWVGYRQGGPGDEREDVEEGGGGGSAFPAFVDPAQRARAPVGPPLAVVDDRAIRTSDDAEAALARTPPEVGVWWNEAGWPVCCERMAVLILVSPTAAELAALVLDRDIASACLEDGEQHIFDETVAFTRAGHRPENGLNLFQCGVCARVYGNVTYT